jgi:cupin 2 domain-containing protein
MKVNAKNIYEDIPDSFPEELIEVIAGKDNVRIERILSRGYSTPDNSWYDQKQDEYVILLKGEAGLLFENGDDVLVLRPGDYLDIPARVKHRVEWTSPDEDTVWLAVHY